MKTTKDWTLVQEDWDFSKCPEKELYFCVQYEYARESESIRKFVSRFKAHKIPISGAWVKHSRLDSQPTWDDVVSGMAAKTFTPVIFDEFPKTPWLLLDPHKRKEISNNLLPIIGRYVHSKVSVQHLSQGERKTGWNIIDEPIKNNTLGTNGVQFLTLMVDWRFGNEQLTRDFLALRPESVDILYREPAVPYMQRGKGARIHRASLSILTAARLLSRHSYKGAFELARHAGKNPISNNSQSAANKKKLLTPRLHELFPFLAKDELAIHSGKLEKTIT